jgi:uncharacterized protein (TIGR02996 family)
MTQEEALLEAMREQPEDDLPRLVYADWLEEHGDTIRGEFIRLQCELAQLPRSDPRFAVLAARESELLREHKAAWLAELPSLEGITWGRFRRGFVSSVKAATVEAWLRHASELGRVAPIVDLEIHVHSSLDVELLWDCPSLARCPSLRCHATEHGRALARALATSPFLRRLRELDLCACFIRTEGAEALAASSGLSSLRVLNLHHNSIGDAGAEALAGASWAGGLIDLRLESNHISPAGGRALGRSRLLTNLVRLELHSNTVGPDLCQAIAEGPARPALRHFSLGSNRLGDAGAIALASWPGLLAFDYLCLAWNPIGSAGVRTLAHSQHLSGVGRLVLSYNDKGFDYRKHLMEGLCSLYNNGITTAGLRRLAASRYLAGVKTLELWCNDASEASLASLRRRVGMDH